MLMKIIGLGVQVPRTRVQCREFAPVEATGNLYRCREKVMELVAVSLSVLCL